MVDSMQFSDIMQNIGFQCEVALIGFDHCGKYVREDEETSFCLGIVALCAVCWNVYEFVS